MPLSVRSRLRPALPVRTSYVRTAFKQWVDADTDRVERRGERLAHLLLLLASLHDSEDDESRNGDPEQEPERDTVKSLVRQ